jgi:hypothetical protein
MLAAAGLPSPAIAESAFEAVVMAVVSPVESLVGARFFELLFVFPISSSILHHAKDTCHCNGFNS